VYPFFFNWECAREDGRPCFGANGRGDIAGGVWTIPPGVLTTDKAHTFQVTVSKNGGACICIYCKTLIAGGAAAATF